MTTTLPLVPRSENVEGCAWLGIARAPKDGTVRSRTVHFTCGCLGHWFPDGAYLPWRGCAQHPTVSGPSRDTTRPRSNDPVERAIDRYRED